MVEVEVEEPKKGIEERDQAREGKRGALERVASGRYMQQMVRAKAIEEG